MDRVCSCVCVHVCMRVCVASSAIDVCPLEQSGQVALAPTPRSKMRQVLSELSGRGELGKQGFSTHVFGTWGLCASVRANFPFVWAVGTGIAVPAPCALTNQGEEL